eukprot:Blabericola_migrator_1__3183@NODE_1933_length_3541_cov_42_911917_g1236_i0_p1_GENE_NODE_1933_length_3541_cov_42_911917_g1236_i0NODE_1933_length_3541_cov_42_911917_g1236_i0_p1_ORF_typecomplete_len922_score87_55ANAPC4_WD40/PF12894_7/40ANAPC4_WD40/PF12894_7/0_22ANAPC4_WD40/PF12894_7/30ANAPC4_WD40/PF12894_7/58ANAPC4_WD40/PF12894_7/2_9e02ANAPC4_WD40/PF12894_7/3_5e02ANAPC4_WD40/PF12894_7/0_56WD40_like/PF17005_5/23WD40_like/PF17005_5/19WD40_like/PF17005_5/4_5WD40_like/PF17005_5/0_001WD40_like/PF17005_5/
MMFAPVDSIAFANNRVFYSNLGSVESWEWTPYPRDVVERVSLRPPYSVERLRCLKAIALSDEEILVIGGSTSKLSIWIFENNERRHVTIIETGDLLLAADRLSGGNVLLAFAQGYCMELSVPTDRVSFKLQQRIQPLENCTETFYSAALSKEFVFFGSPFRKTLVCNIEEDRLVTKHVIESHRGIVFAIAVGGPWIFTASDDREIHVHRLGGEYEMVYSLVRFHTSRIWALSFDEGILWSAGEDGTVGEHHVTAAGNLESYGHYVAGGAQARCVTTHGICGFSDGTIGFTSPTFVNGHRVSEKRRFPTSLLDDCVRHTLSLKRDLCVLTRSGILVVAREGILTDSSPSIELGAVGCCLAGSGNTIYAGLKSGVVKMCRLNDKNLDDKVLECVASVATHSPIQINILFEESATSVLAADHVPNIKRVVWTGETLECTESVTLAPQVDRLPVKKKFKGESGSARLTACAVTERYVFLGDEFGTIHVLNRKTLEVLTQCRHAHQTRNVNFLYFQDDTFSKEDGWLSSLGSDGRLKVWHFVHNTLEMITSIKFSKFDRALKVCNGRWILAAKASDLLIWDWNHQQEVCRIPNIAHSVSDFSTSVIDETLIIVANHSHSIVTYEIPIQYTYTFWPMAVVAVSSYEDINAAIQVWRGPLLYGGEDGVLRTFGHIFYSCESAIKSLAYDEDNDLTFVGCGYSQLFVFGPKIRFNRVLRLSEEADEKILCMCIVSGYLLVGLSTGKLCRIRLDGTFTRTPLIDAEKCPMSIVVKWQTWVYIGFTDGTIQVWDVDQLVPVHSASLHSRGALLTMSGGMLISGGDDQIIKWTDNLRVLETKRLHNSAVRCVGFHEGLVYSVRLVLAEVCHICHHHQIGADGTFCSMDPKEPSKIVTEQLPIINPTCSCPLGNAILVFGADGSCLHHPFPPR